MRVRLLIGALAGLLSVCGVAPAQTYPAEVPVAVPRVQVRSGPSDKFYATGELVQGQRVLVLRECKDQPGWLEVKPPPGSFTWINAKHVQQVKVEHAECAVVTADAPGLMGSAVISARPNVETKPGFLAGSVLDIVDRPLAVDGETWLPVKPHAREVRYIPADAVARPVAVATPTTPANWALGTKSNTPPTTPIPGHPGGTPPEIKPVGNNTTAFSPTPAAPPAPKPAPATTTYPPQWSTYGRLRSTTFTKDGQPMYVLVDSREQPVLYVTTPPGMSLKSYLNQTLSLYGPIVYRPDEFIRTPYMVAYHLAVP
jgi:hypothetical protein